MGQAAGSWETRRTAVRSWIPRIRDRLIEEAGAEDEAAIEADYQPEHCELDEWEGPEPR